MRSPIRLCLAGLLCSALLGCGVGSGMVKNSSGRRLFRTGNYTAAAGEFAQASMDNPGNATYAYNLGRSLAKMGRTAEAEHHFKRALAIDPRHQPTYHGYATMLNESGRSGEAEQLLTSWASTQPHLPAAHIELANLKKQQGDYVTAEASLKQALAVDPGDPIALAHLGDVYQTSGRGTEAVRMYQQSLARNPFQTPVKNRLMALNAPTKVQQSVMRAGRVPAPQLVAGRPNPPGMPQTAAYRPSIPFGVPPYTTAGMSFSPYRPQGPMMAGGIRPAAWPAVPVNGAMGVPMIASPTPMLNAYGTPVPTTATQSMDHTTHYQESAVSRTPSQSSAPQYSAAQYPTPAGPSLTSPQLGAPVPLQPVRPAAGTHPAGTQSTGPITPISYEVPAGNPPSLTAPNLSAPPRSQSGLPVVPAF